MFNLNKKNEVKKVESNDGIVVEKVVVVDTRDAEIEEQKVLLSQAVELFNKILKGYPVTTQVKQWVESVVKRG